MPFDEKELMSMIFQRWEKEWKDQKNEQVAVPGKVLSTGELDHPITVAAFAFSEKALLMS